MTEQENIHNGHRLRMIEKLTKSASALNDHELLEILLYSFLPRIDTNPISHKLLRSFGSIKKVFSASVNELCSVDGIGKNTAEKIALIGEIFNRIDIEDKSCSKDIGFSFDKCKREIIEHFENFSDEMFEMILLDKKRKPITKLMFDGDSTIAVASNVKEIANAFSLHNPSYIIMAHNHPSGNELPSESDDISTVKMHLLCQMHGAELTDHIIIAKDNCFSYFMSGRLADVIKKHDLNNLFINSKKGEENE